jgi:hypothetical protein
MDHLHNEIIAFQRRVNDHLDDPSHPIAQSLRQEVQCLEDDAQTNKNPRSVENRVKQVVQLLEKAGEEKVMSSGHADEMIDQCEEFIQELRKLR